MTKDELVALAAANNIDINPRAVKADIVDALTNAGIELDPPAPVRVEARWMHTQPVFVPKVGVIRYGDTFTVTAEQLAHDVRLIPADDPFTPADEADTKET